MTQNCPKCDEKDARIRQLEELLRKMSKSADQLMNTVSDAWSEPVLKVEKKAVARQR